MRKPSKNNMVPKDGRVRSGRKAGMLPRAELVDSPADLMRNAVLGTGSDDPALKFQLFETIPGTECRAWQDLRSIIAGALDVEIPVSTGNPGEAAPNEAVLTSLARFLRAAQTRNIRFFQEVVIEVSPVVVRYGKRLVNETLSGDLKILQTVEVCETEEDFAGLAGLGFLSSPSPVQREGVTELNRMANKDKSTVILQPPLGLLRRFIDGVRGKDVAFFEQVISMLSVAKSAPHPFAPTDPLVHLLLIFHAQCKKYLRDSPPADFTFSGFKIFAGGLLGEEFPNYRHARAVAKSLGIPFAKDRPGPKSV